MADCYKEVFDLARKLDPDGKIIKEASIREAVDSVAAIKDQAAALKNVTGSFQKLFTDAYEKKQILSLNEQLQKANTVLRNQEYRSKVMDPKFKNKHGSAMLATLERGAPGFGIDNGHLQLARIFSQDVSGNLVNGLEKLDALKLLVDRSIEKDVLIDKYNADLGKPLTKSTMVQGVVKLIGQVENRLKQGYQDVGNPIGKVVGWAMSQAHDAEKIAKDVPKWINTMMQRLDHEQTFPAGMDEKGKVRWLGDKAQEIIDGIHNPDSGPPSGFAGKEARSQRAFHFKDGENFYEYNKEFGKRSLIDSLLRKVDKEARSIELIRMFGSGDIKETVEKHIKDISFELKRSGNEKALKEFEGSKSDIMKALRISQGVSEHPSNDLAIKFGETARSLVSWKALPYTAIKAGMLDPWSAVYAIKNATGQNILENFHQLIPNMLKNIPKENHREVLLKAGMFANDVLHDLHRYGYGEITPTPGDNFMNYVQKGNDLFYKATGIHAQESVMKGAIAKTISNRYASVADKSFEQLHPNMQYTLESFGIANAKDPRGWEVLKLAKEKYTHDDSIGITTNAIGNITKDDLAFVYGERASSLHGRYISDLKNKYGALQQMAADQTVMAPSARYNRMLTTMFGFTHGEAGTWAGQVMRTVFQFKNAALTSQDLVRRVALPTGELTKGSAASVAGFLVGATVLGFGAGQMLKMAKGQKLEDPKDPETWGKAFLNSGAFGLYENLVNGIQYGDVLKSAAGPTFGAIGSALTGPTKFISEKNPMTPTKYVENIGTQGKNFVPLYGIKSPVDFSIGGKQLTVKGQSPWDTLMFNHIDEVLNPGSQKRREKNRQRYNK